MQKTKEAMALLDMSLKLYTVLDPENLMKFKNLSLLAAVMETMGHVEMSRQLYTTIFKHLD